MEAQAFEPGSVVLSRGLFLTPLLSSPHCVCITTHITEKNLHGRHQCQGLSCFLSARRLVVCAAHGRADLGALQVDGQPAGPAMLALSTICPT